MRDAPGPAAAPDRLSRRLQLASVLLYAASLALPALRPEHDSLPGLAALVIGLVAMFDGFVMPAWFANPVYAVAMMLLARSRWRHPRRPRAAALARAPSVVAAGLSLTWLAYEDGIPAIGWFAWQSSLLLGCLAALVSPEPHGARASRRAGPPRRERARDAGARRTDRPSR